MELDALNEQEFLEFFKVLVENGWEPRICDTEYPYYDTPIMCGQPTGLGDVIIETTNLPEGFLDVLEEYMVRVRGDSMKDAFIFDGDLVKVNTKIKYYDGDYVAVWADGEFTLKTYCEDKDGTPWLVPQNSEYESFTLKDRQDARVVGKVVFVLHPDPHATFRSCEKSINKAKAKMREQAEIPQLKISQTIREVAPMIKVARQWYAVFRAMADAAVVKQKDFETFCSMIRSEVPEHKHLPASDEIQRMAIQSFAKPVNKWVENDAPVSGKRFDVYLDIAKQMSKLLGIL